MKLKQLNEATLVEKEVNVSGVDIKDIEMSKEVKDLLANKQYQAAYEKSKVGVDEEQMFVVSIFYYPTKGHMEDARRAGGTSFLGYDKNAGYASGYLQENKNKKVSAGGLKNIPHLGSELLDVVNDTNNVVREGYFKLSKTKEGATPYTKEAADTLVKKLNGLGSGVRGSKIEQVNREKLGKIGSEKEIVLNDYLTAMLGTNEPKIKDFKDLVGKVAIELRMDNKNPIIKFLNKYLSKYDMTKRGFTALNNLYATGRINANDLTEQTYLTKLLNSDLFKDTASADAEDIVDTYKELSYLYAPLNAAAVKSLAEKQEVTILDDTGSFVKDGKRNLANAVIYQDKMIGKAVRPVGQIAEILRKLKLVGQGGKPTTGSSQGQEAKTVGQTQAKPTVAVTGAVPSSVAPDDKAKYDAMLKDVKAEDIPAMMAYLKNIKKFVG